MAGQDKRVIEQQATSEVFADDWFLKDSVTEGTTKISSENLKAWINDGMATKGDIETVVKNIADTYSESESYAEGDLCIHEYALFKCTGTTTGTWDSTKWQATTVAELLDSIDLSAEAISYDNTSSGLEADNVQDAIDEVLETAGKVDDVKVDGESVVDENKVANIDLSAFKIVRDIPNTPTAIATFSDGANLPMPKLEVGIEPVQEGSGDPSPTNVRPISGWDEVNVGVVGKNLCKSTIHGYVNTANDLITIDNDTESAIFYAHEGKTYTISSSATMNRSRLALVETDNVVHRTPILQKEILDDNVNTWTATWAGWTVWYKCSSTQTAFETSVQIEYGTTATTYEPYNGQTITLDLDGTRYGGKVDLVSGVMTVDRIKKALSANDAFVKLGDTTVYLDTWLDIIKPTEPELGLLKCSHYKEALQSSATDSCVAKPVNNRAIIFYDSIHATSVNNFKAYITEQINNNTPIEVVYELATPLTIQLPTTVVKSLRGVNNISANSGDVRDGKYIADASLTIASLDARITALENQ